jgi:hypothetical protein
MSGPLTRMADGMVEKAVAPLRSAADAIAAELSTRS